MNIFGMNENENELSDWGLDMDSQDLDNILGLPPVWDEWKMSAYSELPPDGEGYRQRRTRGFFMRVV